MMNNYGRFSPKSKINIYNKRNDLCAKRCRGDHWSPADIAHNLGKP